MPTVSHRYLDWRVWAVITVVFGSVTVIGGIASPVIGVGQGPGDDPQVNTTDHSTETPTATETPSEVLHPTTAEADVTETTISATPQSAGETETPGSTGSATSTETKTKTETPGSGTETETVDSETETPGSGTETETDGWITADEAAATATAPQHSGGATDTLNRTRSPNTEETRTVTESLAPTATQQEVTATEQDSPTDQPTERTATPLQSGRDSTGNDSANLENLVTVLAGLVTIVSGMSSAVTFVLERRRTPDSGQATLDDYVR